MVPTGWHRWRCRTVDAAWSLAPRLVVVRLVVAGLVVAGLVVPGLVAAYEQESTLDAGAGVASAGGYRLEFTIGQSDTGSTTDGQYRLDYGFWRPAPAAAGSIFSDGFESTEASP